MCILKFSENLCVAGGVAYNGYMNEELTKHYTRAHIPRGLEMKALALGTYMHAQIFY